MFYFYTKILKLLILVATLIFIIIIITIIFIIKLFILNIIIYTYLFHFSLLLYIEWKMLIRIFGIHHRHGLCGISVVECYPQ